MISFGCDPKRVTELTDQVWTVIKELRAHPVSADDVKKVSAAQQRSHEVNLKTNDYWLGALTSNRRRGEPTSALNEYWDLHTKLTPTIIYDAARHYLKAEPNVQITLLPQEESSAPSQ